MSHRIPPSLTVRRRIGGTPTELRLAALVAEGRSTPDIAAEMLLSRGTVQTHVSGFLAKLGFGSRIEIARGVERQPAVHPTRQGDAGGLDTTRILPR